MSIKVTTNAATGTVEVSIDADTAVASFDDDNDVTQTVLDVIPKLVSEVTRAMGQAKPKLATVSEVTKAIAQAEPAHESNRRTILGAEESVTLTVVDKISKANHGRKRVVHVGYECTVKAIMQSTAELWAHFPGEHVAVSKLSRNGERVWQMGAVFAGNVSAILGSSSRRHC